MIRISGHVQPPQDPKLKVPPIGSHGAVAAVARLSAGETSTLKDEIAGLRGRLKALEGELAKALVALTERILALETAQMAPVPVPTVPIVPEMPVRAKPVVPKDGEPWVAEGVSRRTWYRRQAEAKGSQ